MLLVLVLALAALSLAAASHTVIVPHGSASLPSSSTTSSLLSLSSHAQRHDSMFLRVENSGKEEMPHLRHLTELLQGGATFPLSSLASSELATSGGGAGGEPIAALAAKERRMKSKLGERELARQKRGRKQGTVVDAGVFDCDSSFAKREDDALGEVREERGEGKNPLNIMLFCRD